MNFKRPRVKNEKHLNFIRSLPCVVCQNNIETEAAHVRAGELALGKWPTGGGEKPSDCWTVPLCGRHHREQHSMNEREFWSQQGINPFVVAMALYASSGDYVAGEQIINSRGRHGDSNASVSRFGQSHLA